MSTQDAYEAAREAAVERMARGMHDGSPDVRIYPWEQQGEYIKRKWRRRAVCALDAGLAVPECPDCDHGVIPAVPGEPGARKLDLLVWVKPCPSCGGSGQSSARVLIGEPVTRDEAFSAGISNLAADGTALQPGLFRALAPTPEAEKETQ